jgi:hypothetical protein
MSTRGRGSDEIVTGHDSLMHSQASGISLSDYQVVLLVTRKGPMIGDDCM